MNLTPLDELSFGKRCALAVAIVIAALLLLLILTKLFGDDAQAKDQDFQIYQGIPLDAELLDMDKRGLKDAYHNQVLHLWEIWLRGGVRSNEEISAGLKNARRAYEIAAKQIELRERQLQDYQKQGTPK